MENVLKIVWGFSNLGEMKTTIDESVLSSENIRMISVHLLKWNRNQF